MSTENNDIKQMVADAILSADDDDQLKDNLMWLGSNSVYNLDRVYQTTYYVVGKVLSPVEWIHTEASIEFYRRKIFLTVALFGLIMIILPLYIAAYIPAIISVVLLFVTLFVIHRLFEDYRYSLELRTNREFMESLFYKDLRTFLDVCGKGDFEILKSSQPELKQKAREWLAQCENSLGGDVLYDFCDNKGEGFPEKRHECYEMLGHYRSLQLLGLLSGSFQDFIRKNFSRSADRE